MRQLTFEGRRSKWLTKQVGYACVDSSHPDLMFEYRVVTVAECLHYADEGRPLYFECTVQPFPTLTWMTREILEGYQ